MSAELPLVSDELCAHVSGVQFTQLPAGTVVAARRAILDGIGVMLAASGASADVQPFISLARSSGSGNAVILGTGLGCNAPSAALANGAMAHALDFEDAFDRAPVHPNASLLPAALAIAQAHGPIDGREFITAVATGCDIACRMALSLRQSLETGGWYPPAILGAFGAVAAASRLLRLSPLQVRDAFSLMLCQNSCPGEIRYSPTTVIRAVREAFPAQAATNCALLAQGGVRGFEQPLEGRAGFFQLFAGGHFEPRDLLDDLGQRFWIEQLSFKPWPSCRGTHAYIELAQKLRQQHTLLADAITRVVINGGPTQQMLCEPLSQKRAPQTIIDAKFSLPFTVAMALHGDAINLASFSSERLGDASLLALAQRCEFSLRPNWGRERATAGQLEIHLSDGRRFEDSLDEALGHPSRPLSDNALLQKFQRCAALAAVPLSSAVISTLADQILALEHSADAGAALIA